MKVDNYELLYLMCSFAVNNFTETYMDISTSCSEGSVQNSKPEENLSISSGNKLEIILTEDSISEIPSGINPSIPSENN